MPRLVDHEERRAAIIRTTWNIIATRGIDNATMRDIASECGYATPGIISHYFANKNELLLAAYELICQHTDQRIARVLKSRQGLDALLALCFEIIPADEITTSEARVAIAFWQRAQTDEALRRIGAAALNGWKVQITQCLNAAKTLGEVPRDLNLNHARSELINTMMGLHITSMLDPAEVTSSHQRHLLKKMIDRYRSSN